MGPISRSTPDFNPPGFASGLAGPPAWGSSLPHEAQYRDPSSFSAPQRGQNIGASYPIVHRVQRLASVVGAMHFARPIRLALALCLVAAALAGCGGSSDKPESNQTQAANASDDYGHPASEHDAAERKIESTGKKQARQAESAKPNATPAGQSGSDGGSGQDRPESDGGSRTAEHPPVRIESSKCGKRISGEDCAALKVYEEQNHGNPPQVTATNECPAAMSGSECEAAGKVNEEAQANSHVVKPGECPRAMTEAQCIEAGEVFAEAAK